MNDLPILIIDDNEDDLEAISRELRKSETFNNPIIPIASPAEGLNVVRTQSLLCVFIDFHFPMHNGLSLLQDIKDINPRLPVIF